MKFKKVLWTALGCVGLGLGAVGVVVPLLPSFPFLLLALVGFAKSSEKLHRWFLNTRLYKNNLESYVQGRGMTWRTKRRIILTVTLLMAFGFAMMLRKELYVPCAILQGCGCSTCSILLCGSKRCGSRNRQEEVPPKTPPMAMGAERGPPQGERRCCFGKDGTSTAWGGRPLLLWATALLAT